MASPAPAPQGFSRSLSALGCYKGLTVTCNVPLHLLGNHICGVPALLGSGGRTASPPVQDMGGRGQRRGQGESPGDLSSLACPEDRRLLHQCLL